MEFATSFDRSWRVEFSEQHQILREINSQSCIVFMDCLSLTIEHNQESVKHVINESCVVIFQEINVNNQFRLI